MLTNKIKNIKPQIEKEQPVFYIQFEDYLKPTNVYKNRKPLLLPEKPELRLKLLEHPVLVAGRKPKWQILKEKIQKFLKIPKKPKKQIFLRTPERKRSPFLASQNEEQTQKVKHFIAKWRFKTNMRKGRWSSLKLPEFLSFLRARNDDDLCKRKSGFEIYCEMASIHGFINFVGSTTGQRAFWCFVIFVAIAMSGFILLLSHLMNTSTPTILYTESTQFPTWIIPFPAVTICNMNLMSKTKVNTLAERFQRNSNLTKYELVNLFRLFLYTSQTIKASKAEYEQLDILLQRNNLTLYELGERLTPNCETLLQRCKWKGRHERCKNIFERVPTSTGMCCAFNSHLNQFIIDKRTNILTNEHVEYTTSCGSQTGLTVLINPELEDYHLTQRKVTGLKVFIRDAHDFTNTNGLENIITPDTVNYIQITPQQTHSTDYLTSLDLRSRRCYLANERRLFHFRSYSQVNCLMECRSQKLYEKCRCTLPYWPKKANWPYCGIKERECVIKNKALYTSVLQNINDDYKNNYYAERFICDCYPLCDFNMYSTLEDSGKLNRQYSLTDLRFFKDINITNHIVLHVFYANLYAERLRLDVYENWLTFIGTFGGITGLHMGYSFVSGFEMIFFVFVRPACNWLTKKQIRYRIKRRQRKAQLEAEKKRKAEEEREQQERIEAFSRMRPYCPY
ncbi:pickpocket protein 11-like [Musca autumnalis]|uniref:pickpocket protein 11-like n=1 Tax=Musca autumnalis TaxID=221902 RepID=UPI003CE8F43B